MARKRTRIREHRLKQLESQLPDLLKSCLEECARGRWGLFGQNELADPGHRYSKWPKAEELHQMTKEIQALQSEFGQSNDLCESFLRYRSLRGPNVPGEPKLAQQLLSELEGSLIGAGQRKW